MARVKVLYVLFLSLLINLPLTGWADNRKVATAALKQVGQTLVYDPNYTQISYPMGDIPVERGVCSDVVVRALRAQQVDLQQLVHQDMQTNFRHYPNTWGLTKTDKNIDHRRVPNLEIFFKRHGKSQQVTKQAKDYLAGDIVSWRLDNGRPHIGIVSINQSKEGTPLIIHNIGWGTQQEDVLFAWTIVGHYRYFDR